MTCLELYFLVAHSHGSTRTKSPIRRICSRSQIHLCYHANSHISHHSDNCSNLERLRNFYRKITEFIDQNLQLKHLYFASKAFQISRRDSIVMNKSYNLSKRVFRMCHLQTSSSSLRFLLSTLTILVSSRVGSESEFRLGWRT
jgi:hypothetical protein